MCHGIRAIRLTSDKRKEGIRSSMVLNDKLMASNVLDKIKAKLVEEGDKQDRQGLVRQLVIPSPLPPQSFL
jgi:hypothetical protein